MAEQNNYHKTIRVEVAFALPAQQVILELQVKEGCTAIEAIERSGIQEIFPDIELDKMNVGIFSRVLNGKDMPLPHEYVLRENDRVEIYRPLENHPRQARIDRVKKARQAR